MRINGVIYRDPVGGGLMFRQVRDGVTVIDRPVQEDDWETPGLGIDSSAGLPADQDSDGPTAKPSGEAALAGDVDAGRDLA